MTDKRISLFTLLFLFAYSDIDQNFSLIWHVNFSICFIAKLCVPLAQSRLWVNPGPNLYLVSKMKNGASGCGRARLEQEHTVK